MKNNDKFNGFHGKIAVSLCPQDDYALPPFKDQVCAKIEDSFIVKSLQVDKEESDPIS